MSKKVEPAEYLDEDYLFLVLKLLDYPEMKKDEFIFSKIRTEKYKHAKASDIFYDIINFNEQGLLKIERLKLDGKDYRTIKKLTSLMIKLSEQQEPSLNIKKMLDNNFHVYDLEIVLSCCEFKNDILNLIDFDIRISKEFKQKYIKWLKGYLKLFANGKLESKTKNYPRVETQKENIKEKINEMSVRFGSILALKDSDFNNKYRFFECILLLEKERFLIIKDISSKRTEENLSNYSIHCELKEKNYSRPFWKIEGDSGFLKFGKKGEKIKIGKKDSRHFRLLKFLLEDFGLAKPINDAFEYIKTNKDKEDSDINDPYLKPAKQIQIIRNTIKELQKKGRLGGRLKIKIGKMKKTIWIKYK